MYKIFCEKIDDNEATNIYNHPLDFKGYLVFLPNIEECVLIEPKKILKKCLEC
jgi:hypothetical protein